jgi:hypothetical protein
MTPFALKSRKEEVTVKMIGKDIGDEKFQGR